MRAGKLFKAADDPDSTLSDLDLSGFDALVEIAPSILERVGVDASVKSLDTMGLGENSSLVNQVSDRAVTYAQQRAAEMVGKRVLPNGDIVDNPDAEWRIDTTTRDEIRRIINEGLQENVGRDEIADQIEESFAFSSERAEMIANTEIAMANSQAVLDTYHEAAGAGVRVMKEWQADEDACDECLSNEDVGAIELDDVFPTGDDAPPAHPWCECVLVPVVIDEPGENAEENTDE